MHVGANNNNLWDLLIRPLRACVTMVEITERYISGLQVAVDICWEGHHRNHHYRFLLPLLAKRHGTAATACSVI